METDNLIGKMPEARAELLRALEQYEEAAVKLNNLLQINEVDIYDLLKHNADKQERET